MSQSVQTNKSAINTNEEIPFSDTDITFETQLDNSSQYTKTDINRMTTSELQELAYNNGVENAYEMTGSALKQLLIQQLGL